MSADIANDSETLEGVEESTLQLAPGGLQYYTDVTKIEIYCLLQNYQDKGAADKATKSAAALVEEEQEVINKGNNKGANVDWNARSQIEFLHKITDGSE